jgi:hypothetical protein
MKTYKKTVLLLIISTLPYIAYAQCDHSDDFWASFGTHYLLNDILTTQNGWTAYSQEDYTLIGGGSGVDNYDEGVSIINDYAGYLAYIASPVFNDGCKSIKFSYMEPLWDPTDMKVEIKQNGTVVWDSIVPTFTVGSGGNYIEFSVNNIDIKGEYQLVISNISTDYSMLVVKDICLTKYVVIPVHNFQFNVPKDATVYVGDKDQTVTVAGNYLTKHYIPFTKKDEIYIAETDTSRIWYYNLPSPKNSSGGFNYRVTRAGKAPHVGLFKPKTGTTVESDTLLRYTNAQLSLYDAKAIDHNVNDLAGRNVADVFLNINAQGFLTLPLKADTTFQIVNCRNWQAIDTDVNNYFIDPDYHYTVLNENGVEDNSVIAISDSGKITPKSKGTAIVLVTYDAMVCHHTTNVGVSDVKVNGAFFSAIWPENTGVFVVAVDEPESAIKSNMLINQYWSSINGTDKVDSTQVDAEQDILYYEANQGSFPYTFKPEGVSQVLMATPTVEENSLSYSGFNADSVTVSEDGSYTVHLSFGRNVIKLIAADGSFKYQVITAKPVTWTVSGGTGKDNSFLPGDKLSVLFNTLYHPCNKLSGIYNMSAGIQYTGVDVNFPLILGPGQYTFASKAQTYTVTIPSDYTEDEYVLTNGVIKVKGFGSYYGQHRNITLQNGVAPNLNASVRTGYFGSLPEIHVAMGKISTGTTLINAEQISVYPNPFTNRIVVKSDKTQTLKLFTVSGQCVANHQISEGENCIDTSTLPRGLYILQIGKKSMKIVK